MAREQMGQDLPSSAGTLMACDQMALTRSAPIVLRNSATLTARPPQS